ncbi:MAG: MBL fold metallo-hydrolase [Woeseia sp.]|nr:MBL fold metallo-hydrolase [Woeseia sp.]
MKRLIIISCMLVLSLPAIAHEYLSLDDVLVAFGLDIENTEVRSEALAPGIYNLRGVGGNIVASIGDQGVLLVDSQFPEMIPRVKRVISELGGDGIDFTINTHWHFDHSDGNPVLGRDGTWMVAQENSRRMMTGEHPIDLVALAYMQPAYPKEALPVITYRKQMQFHFNGETIDLLHFGPAHTTGDTAVIFRKSNVVHMGDVLNQSYPFIDAGNGGGIEGMILFCEKVLARIDENTKIVPGHGRVKTYKDMAAYIAMLDTVATRISNMIDQGMSLEQVIAAAPTAEFDDQYGDPGTFINRAYVSLAR